MNSFDFLYSVPIWGVWAFCQTIIGLLPEAVSASLLHLTALMAKGKGFVAVLGCLFFIFVCSSLYLVGRFAFFAAPSREPLLHELTTFRNMKQAANEQPVATANELSPALQSGLMSIKKLLTKKLHEAHSRDSGEAFFTLFLASLTARPGRPSDQHMKHINFFPTCFELLEFLHAQDAQASGRALRYMMQAVCTNRAQFERGSSDRQLQLFAGEALPDSQHVRRVAAAVQAAKVGGLAMSSTMQTIAMSEAVRALYSQCLQPSAAMQHSIKAMCDSAQDVQELLSTMRHDTQGLLQLVLSPGLHAVVSKPNLKTGEGAGDLHPDARTSAATHLATGWILSLQPHTAPTEYHAWQALDSPWLPVTAAWILLGTPANRLGQDAEVALQKALQVFASPFGYGVLCSYGSAHHTNQSAISPLHAAAARSCNKFEKRPAFHGQALGVVLPYLNALLHWGAKKHGLHAVAAVAARVGTALVSANTANAPPALLLGGAPSHNTAHAEHAMRTSAVDCIVISAMEGLEYREKQAWLQRAAASYVRLPQQDGTSASVVMTAPSSLQTAAIQYFACNTAGLGADTRRHCASQAVQKISWQGNDGAAELDIAARTDAKPSDAHPLSPKGGTRPATSSAERAGADIKVQLRSRMCAPAAAPGAQRLPLGVPASHRWAPAYAACCTEDTSQQSIFHCPKSGDSNQQPSAIWCRQLNDGLCDCPATCADETATSAHGAERSFWCPSGVVRGAQGHALSQLAATQVLGSINLLREGRRTTWPVIPAREAAAIPVSRVADGVCDCVDGEDEMQWGGADCADSELCAVCTPVSLSQAMRPRGS